MAASMVQPVSRQLATRVRECDRQARHYGRRIPGLARMTGMEKVAAIQQRVSGYVGAIRTQEGQVFELYGAAYGQGATGEAMTQRIMLSYASHDLAHLADEWTFMIPSHIKRAGLLPSQEVHLSWIGNNLGKVLLFRNYPLRLISSLASQYENRPLAASKIDLHDLFYTLGASAVFRSVTERVTLGMEEFSQERCDDAQYCGILLALESGINIKSVDPYVSAMFKNIVINAFKIMLWGGQAQPGAKLIVSARKHPTYQNIVCVEIIDNGPGFDLSQALEQALNLNESGFTADDLPRSVADALTRANGSPYAFSLTINEIMEMLFLCRLTASPETFGSGLGLYGGRKLMNQFGARVVPGINHKGIPPFDTGARFMIFLPVSPHAFMPDTSVLVRDMQYGAGNTPFFTGE